MGRGDGLRSVHWLWLGLIALVGGLLVVHRWMTASSSPNRPYWNTAWFVVGLLVVGLIYPMYEQGWFGAQLDEPSTQPGLDAALLFVSAYVLEYALAFDEAIVIDRCCAKYRVPWRVRPRVVSWALAVSLVVRLVLLAGATWFARSFAWAFYLFGLTALVSFVSVLRTDDDDENARETRLVGALSFRGRLVRGERGGAFWVEHRGQRALTSAGLGVLVLVCVDCVFAIDSVWVVALTTTTFIVVAANVLATIAVRSWLVSLERVHVLAYPRTALLVLIGAIAVKLFLQHHVQVSPAVMFVVLIGLLTYGVRSALDRS